MDLHHIFRYSVPSVEISYDWKLDSVTNEFGNSPDSPFSSHFDNETNSGLSNGQENYSSTYQNYSESTNNHLSSETESPNLEAPSSFKDNHMLNGNKMIKALQEIESALMEQDFDDKNSPSSVVGESPQERGSRKQKLTDMWEKDHHSEFIVSQPQQSAPRKQQKSDTTSSLDKRPRVGNYSLQVNHEYDIKAKLMKCARALSENKISDFDQFIREARNCVSISGAPIQRLGAYMVEGLVARKEASGNNIYRALRCKEPESKELLSYMQILYESCPYFKFGYMAANGAIAEAFKNEDHVHIIDFQIAQGTQWVTLIQALAARPGGPPHVRITGIDDPVSKYARGTGLEFVGKRLAAMSEKFKIPLEFHPMPVYASEITRDMLVLRPGEALAVNFTLQLHHTPDESVDVNNPRDGLLRMVKSLSPKVTTLVEQESNTNTTPFLTRFEEVLNYYSAIFESIDVTRPRDSKERINVEQQCLARDIVNIIACEGKDRVERHELLGKWKSRLSMAGFRPYPLSSHVNSVISSLLASYSENYTRVEEEGAMLLGWKGRNLISASAWQ